VAAGVHERELATRALARGVGFDRLSTCYFGDRKEAVIVLGYGAM